jgi:HSP20 family protein
MRRSELSREGAGTGSLRRFRHQMDRLFDSFFGLAPWEEESTLPGSGSWTPDLEVADTGKEIVVKVEVPGLGPEDIDVRVTGNTLTLSGEKKEEREEKREGYYRSERRFGSFYRTVPLPAGAKSDAVTADYDKGVLTVRIAKTDDAVSKRIEVRSRKE